MDERRGIEAPLVALSFDDGPSEWTDPILDVLAEHGFHATFFVLGAAISGPEREETLRRIVREGSEVGNHTFSHPNLEQIPDEEVVPELVRTSLLIEQIIGEPPRYFRPPFFASRPGLPELVAGYGLLQVGASVAPEDWAWTAERTTRFVLETVQPGDIVDLHDGRPAMEPAALSTPTRDETVAAVRAIVPALAERGLRGVTVSELAACR